MIASLVRLNCLHDSGAVDDHLIEETPRAAA